MCTAADCCQWCIDRRARQLLHRLVLTLHGAQDGNSALHVAVQYQAEEVVTLLLQAGANVNLANKADTATDNGGLTPLHFAVFDANSVLVHNLVEAGASVNATDALGETPLHKASRSDAVEIAQLLVQKGASTGVASKSGHLPIEFAQSDLLKQVVAPPVATSATGLPASNSTMPHENGGCLRRRYCCAIM
eukprot:m.10209 g.10209  ORF g.10209 m.10209 type:complete len:191 (+) comp3068_c0_seq1:261-833(+)